MLVAFAAAVVAFTPNNGAAWSRAPRARIQASATGYDTNRAVNIFKELGARAAGMTVGSDGTSAAKSEILGLLAPFGDPALNVPEDTFEAVNAACRQLERSNPTPASACVPALEGAWRVRYSDAPPPSNGALGPLRGRAYQIIDVDAGTYSNELSLFGGALQLKLKATFEQKDKRKAALRVAFRSITVVLAGIAFPAIDFPSGTERTWLLTYTDDDTRIVRAGVDGGRSTAREIGLIAKGEGEAADSYLFVLTKAPDAEASGGTNPIAAAAKRRALKAELLEAMDGQRLGADSSSDDVARVRRLMMEMATVNPTADPASSPLLCGRWDIAWTTESELLALTGSGFFGLPCTDSYQGISRERTSDEAAAWEYKLDNNIDFDGGFLRVGSTCAPEQRGGRVNFKFESCKAKWKAVEVPLPPVGAGWFEVLYLDEELRLARDSRGDLQVCRRG